MLNRSSKLHDFRLAPWCKWDLHFCGMLHSVAWLVKLLMFQDKLSTQQTLRWDRWVVKKHWYLTTNVQCITSQKIEDVATEN
jgi:hypothetical protein